MKLYLSSYRLGNNPEKLVELFGENKRIAVIMNAIDDADEKIRKEKIAREYSELTAIGLFPKELDLRKYFWGKSALKEKLREYGGVWVRGGNTFTLRKAYSYSGFDELLKEKDIDKDFVYAGYSAGICVLSPSLKGLDIVDNPHIFVKGYSPDIIWDGVGIIDYSLAPHYQSNHPEAAGVEKEVAYLQKNKIAYKTLHDGEVIIQEIH